MKFFATPKLSWNEPTLFSARMRDRRGWVLRGLLALFISSVMLLGFYADRNWGGRGPRFSVAGGLAMSAFIGLFLTAMLDAPNYSRQVTISDDNINYFGNAGTHFSAGTWALRDVTLVRLLSPGELGKSFGAMEVWTRRGVEALGVPASLSPGRIAEVLHTLGVRVVLAGWDPGAPAGLGAGDADGPPTALPTATARVDRLDDGDAGRVIGPAHQRVAATLFLGPVVVAAAAGFVLIGYTVYRIKFAGVRPGYADALCGFGGMGLLAAGAWFAKRLGNLLPSLYLRGVARKVIELRPDAAVDPRNPEAVFVDVIPRANWEKVMLNRASDLGFLWVDGLTRCLVYEGDRERWRVPAASLVSVEVESYRDAAHVEGQEGEMYYATVVKARVGDGIWEAPVVRAQVDPRPRTNRRRERNAIEQRDLIRALRPDGALTTAPASSRG